MKKIICTALALIAFALFSTQAQARVLSNTNGVACVIGTFLAPHGMEFNGKGGWDIGDQKSQFSKNQESAVQACLNYSNGKDTARKVVVSVPYASEFLGDDPARFGVLACVKGGGALRFDKTVNPERNFQYQFKESEFVRDGPAIRKHC